MNSEAHMRSDFSSRLQSLVWCSKWFAALGLLVFAVVLSAAVDEAKLQNFIARKFGPSALQNYAGWQSMMDNVRPLSTEHKLRRINEFFNRRVIWGLDSVVWGEADYWATPGETLGKGQGDCEDFAIAKYYSLLNSGVPMNKLRLVYVKATGGNGTPGGEQLAHMVMAYYASPEAEPLILDNLITDIRPASRRPDLTPVFSFNGEGIYMAGQDGKSGSVRLSRWQDLMQRAMAEGFSD